MVTLTPRIRAFTASASDTALPESSTPFPPVAERPIQAWDWMRQTGLAPEAADWVRPEVALAWRRCLEDHALPVGGDRAAGPRRVLPSAAKDLGGVDVAALLERIGPLLQGTQLSFLVAGPDATVLCLAENCLGACPALRDLMCRGSDWREEVLGNNGLGTAALLGEPAAFTGCEHFSERLHAFSTVGYPLESSAGRPWGVLGLVGERSVGAPILLSVMGLIVRLLNAEAPLRFPDSLGAVLRSRRSEPPAPEPSPVGPRPSAYRDVLTENLVRQAVRLQARNIPILITGESGVGKEHLVRLVHAAGCRSNGPLVAINCASIPRDLIESELFGYEGGSFTGARSHGKPGSFLLADKGMLFLDEIGDMSFDLQATLLRVLENSEFVPVGGAKPIRVDVHVVAATNVRLLDAVEQGRFRRDLYYRLNGAQLRIPPLRERPDQRELIEFLLAKECELAGVPLKRLSREVSELFARHPWPGNIRELRNVLRTLVSFSVDEVVTVADLPADFLDELTSAEGHGKGPAPTPPMARPASALSAVPSLEDWECLAIESALQQSGGNVAETARTLGISRSTLYCKLRRYNLMPERRCR